ncbi:hypothetical protein SDC9_189600 [bioreactor metagenome]|uniref:Uncharacterized protein n=1 Tax=bioreactor metagenome TaxID=1076179 RepID=A0A645I0T7_9ZZZZ
MAPLLINEMREHLDDSPRCSPIGEGQQAGQCQQSEPEPTSERMADWHEM